MILLDTDVAVDMVRRYPAAMSWLSTLPEEDIVLPGFVVMELIQGSRNREEQRKVDNLTGRFDVLWPSSVTCDRALSVYGRFHLGHDLGILDALIGQMAVDLDEPIHTFNQRHYYLIPGVRIVQPYERRP